ncbi:MAG TPA: hypothetical protein VFA26_08600, partial [Gemmataceae bacterium]|nr:hypothetical protein [Gemmataceae bacterium]
KNGLPSAFRVAESILPALRQEGPQLIPRLATCFWWGIVTVGHPEDIPRYARVFGAPADDPNLDRLRAMACEQEHDLEQANRCWQDFEKSVAANRAAWPDGQADHARALVWLHMGKNAAALPDADKLKKLPPFLRDLADRLPKPPKPPADECFRRSIELVPDLLEAHQALFDFYRERDQVPKAIKAGREMVQRFPKNVAALESLADLLLKQADYRGAVELFGQALEANPLDRRLRGKLATARLYQARQQAEEGRFDEARAGYQVALGEEETGAGRGTVYCKWAACEFKAGEPARAEELLHKALAESGSRLAVAFSILIEVIRLKLPRALKARFDKEFKEALEEPAAAASAVAVLGTAASHALAGVTYHGQKTHEKKVLAYVGKVPPADFTEPQLEQVSGSLLALEAIKLLRSLAREGQRRFPANPFFPYVEAESYMICGPESCPVWQVRPLLDRAAKLASELPPHDRHRPLLDAIRQRQQMIGAFDSMGGMFGDLFGGFWDDGYDDEDDDDDGPGW